MRQALFTAIAIPFLAGTALAGPTDTSQRPEARPKSLEIVARAAQAIDAATRLDTSLTAPAPKPAVRRDTITVTRSLRPRLRPDARAVAVAVQSAKPEVPAIRQTEPNAGFDTWVRGFRARAMAQGISAATLDAAFSHAGFLPEVIRRDRNQTEFTLSVGQYLGRAASDSRVTNGRASLSAQRSTLRAVEAKYGVPAQYVTAVWGMESNYGANRGDTHLISALATLAYEGRRGAFFEEQLIAALKILQHGDTTEDKMMASWAGAMGHTQFIPTSYLAYAVDHTGDGKRDIWSEDPADALASTAAYLANAGWIAGQPWGVEVALPPNFDFAKAGDKRMPSEWAKLGVKDVIGRAVPDYGSARLLLPAGADGVAFLVFKNFDVIKRYNNSDAYALGVGHLGDRIAGGSAFAGTWPEGERSLKRAEREELQTLLTRRGYSTGGVDGWIGGNTIAAIRAYQMASGLDADGYPSVHLLKRLRN